MLLIQRSSLFSSSWSGRIVRFLGIPRGCTKFQAFRDVMCGYRTYNDLISEDPETVSTVRRIAQRKLEEELEYVETDSVYSYRL